RLGIADRIDARGPLHRAGEDRRLAKREIARRLAEITLRRRLDAGGAVAEEDAVEIELEDLLLGVVLLEPQRQQCLLRLALQRLLGAEEQVLGELLGDGGGAARHLAGLQA